MPLTAIQSDILKAISGNRSPESHIAGGIALNFAPGSPRFSEGERLGCEMSRKCWIHCAPADVDSVVSQNNRI
jgi:hypothetical protein